MEFADGSTADVDVILWATGFRPSLDHLAPLRLREPGGGIMMAEDGVSVVKEPRLFPGRLRRVRVHGRCHPRRPRRRHRGHQAPCRRCRTPAGTLGLVTDAASPTAYTLTLSCPDRPGIVHAVAGALVLAGCEYHRFAAVRQPAPERSSCACEATTPAPRPSCTAALRAGGAGVRHAVEPATRRAGKCAPC